MAGNATAREVLTEARKNGATAAEVYEAAAETFDGLDREQRAWCLGYLARLVDYPEDRNPHDPEDGEAADALARKWAEGWRRGGTGDFADLNRRVYKFRGE